MFWMTEFWLSVPNLQVNHTNLNKFWIIMSYELAIMFVTKYWSSGRIGMTKDPLIFVDKTLILGGINVRTMVL